MQPGPSSHSAQAAAGLAFAAAFSPVSASAFAPASVSAGLSHVALLPGGLSASETSQQPIRSRRLHYPIRRLQ